VFGVVGKHRFPQTIKGGGHIHFGGQIPQVGIQHDHAQTMVDPRLGPSGFGRPDTPGGIAVAAVGLPLFIVKGTEPDTVIGRFVRDLLGADKKFRQFVPAGRDFSGQRGIAGSGRRFVETKQGKGLGVEVVDAGIAVLLDHRRFMGAVLVVGGEAARTAAALADGLLDGAAVLLVGAQIRHHGSQPAPMLFGILDPAEPGERQEHFGPFLLHAVGPGPFFVLVGLHHPINPRLGQFQQGFILGLFIRP